MAKITLEEAHAWGWKGNRALMFVEWRNDVEDAFRSRTGLTIDELLGDWRSADYFEAGHPSDIVVDLLIEQVADDYCMDLDEVRIALEEHGRA